MRRAASVLFLLGIAALPVMHPINIHLFGNFVIPADILFAASGVAWLVAAVRRQVPVRRGRFPIAVAAYLAVVVISGVRAGTTSALNHVVIGFYVTGLALLAYNLVPSVVELGLVVKAWLLGGAVAVAVALVGILLFYAGIRDNFAVGTYGSVPAGDYPRIAGTFLNANMFCGYLVVTGLLFMAAWELAWVSTSQFVVGLVALGVTAAFTLSAGLGGLALAAGIWAWVSPRSIPSPRARRTALTGGVLGAVAFAVLTCVSLSFSHGLHTSVRLRVWRVWATGFLDHPWLGAGLGKQVASVSYVAPSGAVQHIADAHDVWLSVAGHIGVVGVVALGVILVVALGGTRPRLAAAPIPKALVLAFVGAFLYGGIAMSVEDFRQIWLLIGLLAAVTQTAAVRAPLASQV